jgi:leucine dehydrogenase
LAIFEEAAGYERVVFATDAAAGLKTIIAIHSTRLGPSLGGCRIQPYATEDEALTDVLRLARSMTWKASAAGLDLGGGKAVIVADPARDKNELLLRAFGRVVNSLGGRYITSVDVGSSTDDMDEVRRETRHVTGVSPWLGGRGDPSPYTAQGVAAGMGACLYDVFKDTSFSGRRVAIQGVGKVGYALAGILSSKGAEVVVADPSLDHVARCVADFSASSTTPAEILFVECDVLAPCALGGVLDKPTIERLNCRIVCGSANNQLATEDDAMRLREQGILYAPDFVVNAGGLICVADELAGWNEDRVNARVERIGRTLLDVLHRAAATESTTDAAAIAFAEERIRALSALGPR